MCITTVSFIKYLNIEFFKRPMQKVEIFFKRIVHGKPHLINAADRINNHPLIRNYSLIPI